MRRCVPNPHSQHYRCDHSCQKADREFHRTSLLDMLPCAATENVRNCCPSDTILQRKTLLRCTSGPDGEHIRVSQNRFPMILTTGIVKMPFRASATHIFLTRYPFQIARLVIGTVRVAMVNLVSRRRFRWQKGICHELMNATRKGATTTLSGNPELAISVAIQARLQNAGITSDAPKRTGGIQRKIRDHTPFFDGRIGLHRGSFLGVTLPVVYAAREHFVRLSLS